MPRANLPYRGEPEYEYPPPKPRDWNTEKPRGLFGGTLWIVLLGGAVFFVLYFATDRSSEQSLGPVLFIIAIVLAPFALDAGINAWNRYLRADDLDEPEDLDERREETSPKQDDKHDMAEDYLAQLKWDADHLRDPNRGIPPVRYDPKWKYKPLFGKVSGTSFGSSTGWGILFLIALIIVAGLAIVEMITTSHVDIVWAIPVIILLGLILLATREPKEPTDD